jgi:hypothetical protein
MGPSGTRCLASQMGLKNFLSRKNEAITPEDQNTVKKFCYMWDRFLGLGTTSQLLRFITEEVTLEIAEVRMLILNKGGTKLNANLTYGFLINAIRNRFYSKEFPVIHYTLTPKEKESILMKSKFFFGDKN